MQDENCPRAEIVLHAVRREFLISTIVFFFYRIATKSKINPPSLPCNYPRLLAAFSTHRHGSLKRSIGKNGSGRKVSFTQSQVEKKKPIRIGVLQYAHGGNIWLVFGDKNIIIVSV